MRRKEGDNVRLFNGRDGEWLAVFTAFEKKSVTANSVRQLLAQPERTREIHLAFAPIKKARMDFLIEKAVELGATHLHPVLTHNTEMRQINETRLRAQIIEAAEQCERLDIPVVYPLQTLENFIGNWQQPIPVMACFERSEAPFIDDVMNNKKDVAFLIGSEGGFSEIEKERLLKQQIIIPVSLGHRIFRSETAALFVLSRI